MIEKNSGKFCNSKKNHKYFEVRAAVASHIDHGTYMPTWSLIACFTSKLFEQDKKVLMNWMYKIVVMLSSNHKIIKKTTSMRYCTVFKTRKVWLISQTTNVQNVVVSMKKYSFTYFSQNSEPVKFNTKLN